MAVATRFRHPILAQVATSGPCDAFRGPLRRRHVVGMRRNSGERFPSREIGFEGIQFEFENLIRAGIFARDDFDLIQTEAVQFDAKERYDFCHLFRAESLFVAGFILDAGPKPPNGWRPPGSTVIVIAARGGCAGSALAQR